MRSLTALFAEDEEELGGALLHAHVHVGHEPHQLVPDGRTDLRADVYVLQRGENLRGNPSRGFSGAHDIL